MSLALHVRIAPSLAALLCTAALAGPTGVPFSATVVTQEELRPDPVTCQAMPYLKGTTTGTGHATHLGRVTGSATDCVVATSAYAFKFGGQLSLIAANGDELRATYRGMLVPTATPPIYRITDGTYTITGGTGRFSTASGNGTLDGLENLATGQGNFDLKGFISY